MNNMYNHEEDIDKCREKEHRPPCRPEETQTHVHEFLGSTELAEHGNERHNHRFAGVTTEIIPFGEHGHKHAFMVNSDFFDHHHEVAGETGPAINVGDGKHVHFACGKTTIDDAHFHKYQFATLIESPLVHW